MKSKEGPIQAARRINIKAQFMFRFSAKRSSKSPAKSSERTGPGYPEAAEARDPQVMQHSYCGIETAQERYHEIQEMKNRDVLLKYPLVQKESESIKQTFMNKGAVSQGTKNEKIIRRSNWKKTFNPAVKDSNYLGITTKRK